MEKEDFGVKSKLYIVGAHSRAKSVAGCLQYLYPEVSVEAYLVTNKEVNPNTIQGVPVIQLEKDTVLNGEYPVFIATKGMYHKQITKILMVLGMRRIYPVNVELDRKLRNAYVEKYFHDNNRSFNKLDMKTTLGMEVDGDTQACIYVAKSIYDKPLKEKVVLMPYEKIIQVGAALSEQRLEENGIIDSTGDNISCKNRQFCELTGLYWIWKNAPEDMVGLVHYRRHFILPDNWAKYIEQYGIDVVLPVPTYVAPSVAENYKERHRELDWNNMMTYLQEHDENEYKQAVDVFDGKLYSACNMFIMRKSVLTELCSWMFPILEEVVAKGGESVDYYQNRYAGFLSERLITLFFEIHSGKYKVVYADKNFIP